MRNLILLDSGSTDTVFCNKDFVKNIRPSKTQMKINTNRGVMIVKMICDIPDLGTFWYNEFALTTIISLSHMRQKFKITYDSEFEKAIKVHTNKGIVKFTEISNGLYALNAWENKHFSKSKGFQFINTIDENLEFFTPRQILRAKTARTLFETMGTPTSQDLKAMIRMNLI